MAAGSTAPVTFTKDIAPIFQDKCQDCHRKGTAAPMSLITYEEARPWAKSIKQRVVTRQMPPWHLDKTVGIQKFANDMSLSDAQIAKIVSWVDAGAPMGNSADMPAARQWPDDQTWQLEKKLGAPDFVVKTDPYTMPAQGQDVWWKPNTAVPLTEERWVKAVEIRPGSPAGRKITHHATAHLQQSEPDADAGDTNDDADGPGLLMEWAIGKQYDMYRPNAGKLILPGSRIQWTVHLHAVGEQIRDHVELGVWLYPKNEVPKYRTHLTAFESFPTHNDLDIPPNTVSVTSADHVLKAPARIENFQPHMHLRGKAM